MLKLYEKFCDKRHSLCSNSNVHGHSEVLNVIVFSNLLI